MWIGDDGDTLDIYVFIKYILSYKVNLLYLSKRAIYF